MNAASQEIREGALGNYVVLSSALVRGALTAIGWINQEARRIETFATLREAIGQAVETLEANGQPVPKGLNPETYEPPSLEQLIRVG